MNKVRSYKIRGAFNKIKNIVEKVDNPLIVCASAGNHAQGVAYVCKKFKLTHHIFVPENIPSQKAKAIEYHGGQYLTLHYKGKILNDCITEAQTFTKTQKNAFFVHPFDDEDIVEGQSTMGIEIGMQCSKKGIKPDICIVGVGGGGCSGGVSIVMKMLYPDIKIYGVEPENADKLNLSFKLNRLFSLKNVDTFADGTAMRSVGTFNYNILKTCIEKDIQVIPKNKLCFDIINEYQNDGIVLEPSGCLSISALEFLKNEIKGKNIICILSGGNNDLMR